jgi:quinol monooxygenase YgiN
MSDASAPSTQDQALHCVLIIHAVKDYAAWKQVFDQAAGLRKAAGEQRYLVLRDEVHANRIVHFSQWSSLDDAKAFFESPRLVEIRRQAGVEAPEFNYLVGLEHGAL